MKCPVCGGETGVDTPSARRCTVWTSAQLALLRRLVAIGVSLKGCARIFQVSVETIGRRINRSPSIYDRGRWIRTAPRDARGRILPKNDIQGEKERL